MPHPFQCRCGTLRGEVDAPERGLRAVCYCRDCQTYAHLLGAAERVLDPLGGTDIVATQARYVRITAGAESLACLSLSPRGLLRWYARCCNTPIVNMPRDWKINYAGLVHTCLDHPRPLAESFPRILARVNGGSAHGDIPKDTGPGGMLRYAGLMLRLLALRLRGAYRQTPFFDATGQPVAQVVVPPRETVDAARRVAAS